MKYTLHVKPAFDYISRERIHDNDYVFIFQLSDGTDGYISDAMSKYNAQRLISSVDDLKRAASEWAKSKVGSVPDLVIVHTGTDKIIKRLNRNKK